jgi:hypothetical protein
MPAFNRYDWTTDRSTSPDPCEQKGLSSLYPDFEALKREGIQSRDVPIAGSSEIAYTKYYITPTMYTTGTVIHPRETKSTPFPRHRARNPPPLYN